VGRWSRLQELLRRWLRRKKKAAGRELQRSLLEDIPREEEYN
jgi:hypothetical protein